MTTTRRFAWGTLALAWFSTCGDMSGTVDVRVIRTMGETITLKATATAADGTLGKGTVRFTTIAGSLAADSVPLDDFGTATVALECPRAEPDCTMRVTVRATWTHAKGTARGEVNTNVPPPDPTGPMTTEWGPSFTGCVTDFSYCNGSMVTELVNPRRVLPFYIRTGEMWMQRQGDAYHYINRRDVDNPIAYLGTVRFDDWESDIQGKRFPTSDNKPDPRLPTQCEPTELFLGPRSTYGYPCYGTTNAYANGMAIAGGQTLLAVNENDYLTKEASTGRFILSRYDGGTATLALPPEVPSGARVAGILSVADGYLALYAAATPPAQLGLIQFGSDGGSQHLGRYGDSAAAALDLRLGYFPTRAMVTDDGALYIRGDVRLADGGSAEYVDLHRVGGTNGLRVFTEDESFRNVIEKIPPEVLAKWASDSTFVTRMH